MLISTRVFRELKTLMKFSTSGPVKEVMVSYPFISYSQG